MADAWPSLEEQLREAKATPGSALEKLIKDNQDHHLLHPSEVNDGFELPPWLRIYWRKHHPDVPMSQVNPGASYPENLDDTYEWMVRHQDLPWGTRGGPNDPGGGKGGGGGRPEKGRGR